MYKQGKLYAFAATGYLYSTILVDLYRKLIGGSNIELIRNLVYVFFFCLLVYDMFKARHMRSMLAILFVILCLYGFSILLNPGYPEVYSAAILLFVSRLWPAFYIGRYTADWDSLSKSVFLCCPIALVYALSLFLMPELAGGTAYATIASNLAYVSMISLFACLYYKKKIGLPIVLICLIPVFFYGTRVFLGGICLSLFLAYIINTNNVSPLKRAFLFTALFIIAVVFLLCGDIIFNQLYQWFPDSRTLKMMAVGDFMDDSNRSFYYDRIFLHLEENPLNMLGFIGDRIFYSSNGANSAEILSLFSHNSFLELCMNFGLPIGIMLNLYFIRKLIIALKRSFSVQYAINYIYVLILGTCFLNMMVSASYLSDYAIWLLFGLSFNICDKLHFNNYSTYND